jgi:hypothetical protein
MCLNPQNNSTADGAGIVQNTCDLRLSERLWITHQSDTYHTIQFAHTNKCMDLAGASLTWGTQFIQWPCNGQTNQRFSGAFVAESAPTVEQHRVEHSNLCVDVYGANTTENTIIIQWECLAQSNQQWKTRGLHAGTFTAYAMGNLNGAGNVPMQQGMFAHHLIAYCSGDPAANWGYGSTTIQTMNPQNGFHNGTTGASLSYSNFTLEDAGDLSCSQGNYWADLYFGRYKLSGQPCICGGVAGTCYDGVVNQCTDATQYGSHTSTVFARN